MRKHLTILVLATLCTCAFVWVRLQIVSISYDIHRLESRARELREEVNALTLRIDEAKSPQRLERLATTRLKLHPPKPDQVIVLRQ